MSDKWVDFKVTVWCRAHLHKDVEIKDVVELLKQGKGSNDLFEEEMARDWESITETEEPLSVEENQGNCTVEVYEDDVLIWDNTKKVV
jgi:hypothetical protein